MFEYQINVSIGSEHFFRTDWYHEDAAKNIATLIKSSMPLAHVTVSRKSKVMDRQEINSSLDWPWS
jgi:hypothetical protein